MAIIAKLLDKAKKTRSIPSDNALGAVIGVNRQTISQWRHGDSYPSQDHIARLADMGNDDPAGWLVAVQAERETGEAGKAWARLARQLGVAATVAAAALITGWMPLPAHAASEPTLTAAHCMHYAKLRAWARKLLRRWIWSRNHDAPSPVLA